MNENKTYAPSLAVDFADDVFDFVAVKAVLLQGRDQALTREVSVGAAVFLGVEKVTKRHARKQVVLAMRAQGQPRHLVRSGLRFDDLDAGVGRVVGLAALKTVVVPGRQRVWPSIIQPRQTKPAASLVSQRGCT